MSDLELIELIQNLLRIEWSMLPGNDGRFAIIGRQLAYLESLRIKASVDRSPPVGTAPPTSST